MNHVEQSVEYKDFYFKDFVSEIYKIKPQDPFSLRLEFLDQIDEAQLRNHLAYFLISGAKILFNKDLSQINKNEIDKLQEYFHSIGWDFKLDIIRETRFLEIDNKFKDTPVNNFIFDFFPAKHELDIHNVPDKLA